MPIYEYQCRKCGNRFEHLARTLSEAPPPCPKCGAKKVEKQFSTFSPSVASGGGSDLSSSCSTGTCSTGSCPTGTCPFA